MTKMATLVVEKRIPEPVGNNVLIKCVQSSVTEGGIFLPEGKKTDKHLINEKFYLEAYGSAVGQEVRDEVSIGQQIVINFIPNLHTIVTEYEEGTNKIFFIIAQPSDIKCKWATEDNNVLGRADAR